METAIQIATKLLVLLFFPFFVLSNIYLAVAQKPWERLKLKRRLLYYILAPCILIPWAINFCLFFGWANLAENT